MHLDGLLRSAQSEMVRSTIAIKEKTAVRKRQIMFAVLSVMIFSLGDYCLIERPEAHGLPISDSRATEATAESVAARSEKPTSAHFGQTAGNSFFFGPQNIYLLAANTLFRSVADDLTVWHRLGDNFPLRLAAADPAQDNILYAVNPANQILKSVDGGQKWLNVSPGVQPPYSAITTLLVNPADSKEVFAGTQSGILRTQDAGFTWQHTSFGGSVSELLIGPRASALISVLSAGTIFTSSDHGTTWKRSETGLPLVLVRGAARTASQSPVKVTMLLLVDREKPFLLALTDGKGMFRSNDNGASWSISAPSFTAAADATAFVDGDRILIASEGKVHSSSDGAAWSTISIKSSGKSIQSVAGIIRSSARDGYMLRFRFAGDPESASRLGYLNPNGTLLGLNYGVVPYSIIDNVWTGTINGKEAVFAHGEDHTDRTMIPVDNDGWMPEYLANAFMAYSVDNGYSWEFLGSGGPNCGGRTAGFRDLKSIWVYGGNCVIKSEDGGGSWATLSGFSIASGISKLQRDPVDPNLAYYCTGLNDHGLYRYTYDPASQRGQSVALNVRAPDVIVAEDDPKLIFTGSGQASTDGGWTWVDRAAPLNNLLRNANVGEGYLQPLKLLSFRNHEIRLVLFKGDISYGAEAGTTTILKSRNLGETWEEVKSFREHLLIHSSAGWSLGAYVNPSDSANFFIATDVFGAKPRVFRVQETKDSGASWRQIYSQAFPYNQDPPPFSRGLVQSVAQISKDGRRTLFIGGAIGLLRSDDEGKTWTTLGGAR